MTNLTITQFRLWLRLVGGSTLMSFAGPVGDSGRRERTSALVGALGLREGDCVRVTASAYGVYVSAESVYCDDLLTVLAAHGGQANHWGERHAELSAVPRPPRTMSPADAALEVQRAP